MENTSELQSIQLQFCDLIANAQVESKRKQSRTWTICTLPRQRSALMRGGMWERARATSQAHLPWQQWGGGALEPCSLHPGAHGSPCQSRVQRVSPGSTSQLTQRGPQGHRRGSHCCFSTTQRWFRQCAECKKLWRHDNSHHDFQKKNPGRQKSSSGTELPVFLDNAWCSHERSCSRNPRNVEQPAAMSARHRVGSSVQSLLC